MCSLWLDVCGRGPCPAGDWAHRWKNRTDESAERNALHVVVEAPEQLPLLPAAVEVAAYRIVQEALMNVSRHAKAHTCTTRLALADRLHVEVRDYGICLPEAYHAGVGLRSMRERALELGGRCTIERLPVGGRRVQVWLPIIGPS